FFQAEDGIRDFHVTGVQTCALPISFPTMRGGMRQTPRAKRRPCGQLAKEPISATLARNPGGDRREAAVAQDYQIAALWIGGALRSEERRVGKGGGARGGACGRG